MKKLLLTLVLLVGMVFGLMAQKLTYQAVVRDNNQQLVTNTAVKATVTITFSTGNPYTTEVNGSTNIHGLLSIEFGDATLNGRDWTGATIAVKVVKANDESIVYVNEVPRPVSAVPYALSVDGQSIQNYLTEHHYVNLDKLEDTLKAYSTTAAMDARHYLTSDSAVIKTMQGNITTNANSIANLTLHTAKAAIRDSVAGQIHDSISNIAAKAHTHDNMAILNATQAPYTDADSAKLHDIAEGAEVNVQSDWKQAASDADDFIKNKPSITDTVNNILTTGKYVTETTLDARHYLRSDSTVITTMQGNITSLQSGLSAAIGKEKTDSTTLAGRIDALEGAAMDCNKVKECIKDTLSNYSTTAALNDLLQQLTARLNAQDTKMDSLARLVDSLSKRNPGGGDTPTTTFTCGTSKVKDVDLNEYNTVAIGNQCWMAQNLRTNVGDGVYPKYPKDHTKEGQMVDDSLLYGRLYTWNVVTNGASTNYTAGGTNDTIVHGICPAGWHVPSYAEWDTLTNYVNTEANGYRCNGDGTIAKALASKTDWTTDTTACNVGNAPEGNNATGFSAVPAGICLDSDFQYFGDRAYFWSATQDNDSYVWARYLESDDSNVYWSNGSKDNVFSVRCLRDAGIGGPIGDNETAGTTPSTPATMSCEQVMECMGDTLGKLNKKIVDLNATVTTQGQKLDSLAHVVDSLAKLPHGGGEVADGQPCPGAPTVSDGTNTYNTVKIGNQCWMAQNLRTTADVTVGTNCWHVNNSVDNDETYGLLYSWAAVMQGKSTTNYPVSGDKVRGICPAGWHVPSNAEWTQLTTYVNSVADYKCNNVDNNIANALSDTTGWKKSSECGAGHGGSTTLNATGFSAVPAGNWLYDFSDFGADAYFWSATEGTAGSLAWPLHLNRYNSIVISGEYSKGYGFSVRCLKDEGGSSATLPTVTTDSVNTVTNNSATLHGNVTGMGEYSEVNAGFKYGTSESTLTSIVAKNDAMTATGQFSCDLVGLTANTQYYFKAFAANGTDTVYGEVKNFTTKDLAVATNDASKVTKTTATLNGKLTVLEGYENANAGFKYGTSESTLTSIVAKDDAMIATGLFSCDLVGLTANTKYYFKAFAANGTDTVYGEVKDFTTFVCGTSKVKDADLNEYNTVKIGNQCWMKENLRTNVDGSVCPKYPEGHARAGQMVDDIPLCGRLYTWSAVTKGASTNYPANPTETLVHGICPTGWHVPSDAEWTQLTTYVKSESEYVCNGCSETDDGGFTYCIAKALASTLGWIEVDNVCAVGNNLGGNNATGFSAFPAGSCSSGNFDDFGKYAYFWSATQSDDSHAWYRILYSHGSYVRSYYDLKDTGFSVRCLRD